ncbi:MAG TPA: hypothetical protein VKY19_11615 [Ktedonosporobacter sp.]|jgi:hypothetical protein|nr:hypothetical protein [Ktedonosporobacter sp.]
MSIKPTKRGLRNTFFSSKRWKRLGYTLGFGLLVVGGFLLLIGNLSANAASQSASAPSSQKIGPLIPESEWGMWHKGNVAQSFPTTQRPYTIGQTVTVPNYVSIRVDGVDRNWTPQPWQVPPSPVGFQDDAKGKEVILVRFTLTNLSNAPVLYSDHYFSLVRANGHEQRVATLAELTGDQYGSFGRTTPWLLPGATTHTFVPFLVNPGEKPQQFVLSWQVVDHTQQPIVSANSPKGTMPFYANIARIPILLSFPPMSRTQASAASSITFVSDTKFTITGANVYSTD